jgi:peptide/nickel transport system ATP-binding protein
VHEEPALADAEVPGHAFRCHFPVGTEAGREALARNLAAGETATGMPVRKQGDALTTGIVV